MIDGQPPVDKLTEIDFEVRAVTSQAVIRLAQGESLAEIAKDPAIKSTLDYLNTVPMDTSDILTDLPPELLPAIDEIGFLEERHQEDLLFRTEEEKEAMALHMLSGLVDLHIKEQLEGGE